MGRHKHSRILQIRCAVVCLRIAAGMFSAYEDDARLS
jgi:hypothetical protein